MSRAPTVDEGDCPTGATEPELLRFFVNYAVLAPSSHNTQPWLFRIDGSGLDLIADRTRALPVVDPDDRALIISCGAALEMLIVAARRFGYRLEVEVFPGECPDTLARVRVAGETPTTDSDRTLFQAILQRQTTRTKYDKRVLPAGLRSACRELALKFAVELSIIEEKSHRADIAELVAEGDRCQFGNPEFRRELAAWVHSRETGDGMSGDSFGMPDVLSPVGAMVIRTFDIGNGVAAGDREKIVDGSPLLAVFSTSDDKPSDWLATGRALASVLLKITASGATAAFLNQPVEVDVLRPRLRLAVGSEGVPQLLMRFGYADLKTPSGRRAVEDVVVSG